MRRLISLFVLVLLAGCATGAPPGGLFPGMSHVGPRVARARPGLLPAEAPRVSWARDESAADEYDDREDDADEEEARVGAGAAVSRREPGSGTRRPVAQGG